jgi:LmbE family N-acetylglucosaminyl deacetylase
LPSADTIWVIEPHADDAFLGLGWSIREWSSEGKRVGIVTVYTSDESRVKETRQWAEAVGVEWHGLGHDQPASNWYDPGDTVPPLPAPLLPDTMMSPESFRLWPLGLRHPEHIAVASSASDGDWYYLDTPYQLLSFNQERVRKALIGRTIEWWLLPPREKWADGRFFTSQKDLFGRVDQLELVPEVIVR